MDKIKLTSYSHGAGCGCKLSPAILSDILSGAFEKPDSTKLLVGNNTRDDAAVYALTDEMCLVSTTDFFMPIVDDPYDFGRIASANAISDVYAMGGKPIIALAILGWPIQVLSAEIANRVINGARAVCSEAGIILAGGHSIDAPEPIFGLAVNGIVNREHVKRNSDGREGDVLFLTKKLGVGILTTAEKKRLLLQEDEGIAARQMVQLNKIGEALARIDGVHAMTDITGFGLLGHLLEMAEGSGLGAEIYKDRVPIIRPSLPYYIEKGCVPGGMIRNWNSYEQKIWGISGKDQDSIILSDPQTSGGLLVSVATSAIPKVQELFNQAGYNEFMEPIGRLVSDHSGIVKIV